MPALQNLVLADRVPTNHTFVPRDVKNGTGLVVANAGMPLGEERVSIAMRRSGAKFRGDMKIAVPVVVSEVINGVTRPSVARTHYAQVLVTFDEGSTETERNNFIGMVQDSLGTGKTLVNNAFVKLEGVYGS